MPKVKPTPQKADPSEDWALVPRSEGDDGGNITHPAKRLFGFSEGAGPLDIAGSKALRERLALNGEAEPQPALADIEVPEDAPPVFQWFGVSPPERGAPPADADGGPPAAATSLFSRLGLSFR
jgi:hypothetical protein